jgi:hypothetical protein
MDMYRPFWRRRYLKDINSQNVQLYVVEQNETQLMLQSRKCSRHYKIAMIISTKTDFRKL